MYMCIYIYMYIYIYVYIYIYMYMCVYIYTYGVICHSHDFLQKMSGLYPLTCCISQLYKVFQPN